MPRFRWVAEGMDVPLVETEPASYDTERLALDAARWRLEHTPEARGGRFRVTLYDAATRVAKGATELSVQAAAPDGAEA